MKIPVSEAKGHLAELVRRAEAGDEVVLTRRGQDAVRLVPVAKPRSAADRRALMDKVRASAATRVLSGPSAAGSQDFLYDDDGLPG